MILWVMVVEIGVGEVILQNDSDEEFTQRDFTFRVTPLSAVTNTNQNDGDDDFSGTFLTMPRPNDPVMCIELKPDGTIYELQIYLPTLIIWRKDLYLGYHLSHFLLVVKSFSIMAQ